jgi:hypothetical protein
MPSYLDQLLADQSPTPRPTSGRSYLNDIAESAPPPDEGESWLDLGITTGLRVVPSIVGTVGGGALGGLIGAPAAGVGAVPGAAAGAVIGGGVGGGAGEYLAEKYEQMRGLREDVSPGAVGVEAALGAIPLGKSATLTRAGLKGAAMAAGGTAAHSVVEEGELPSLKSAAISGGLGFVLGAGGEKIARRFGGAAEHGAADVAGTAEREGGQSMLDEIAAMREVDEGITARDLAARSQPKAERWQEGAGEPAYLRAQQEVDQATTEAAARARGQVGAEGFSRYAAADDAIQGGLAAEEQAAREAAGAPEQIAGAFDAPIPERLRPPPPEPPRWEDIPYDAATPAEQLLRRNVPPRVLREPGSIEEVGEVAQRARAAEPTPLARLFGDQSGEISSELASAGGGAAVGGVIGASEGETPEERLEYGGAGAAAGALGGAGLARLLARRASAPAPSALRPGEIPARGVPESGLIPRLKRIATPTGDLSAAKGDRPVYQATEPPASIPRAEPMPAAQRENFGLEHFPEDQRDAIAGLIEEYGVGNLETQRRGRQSIARQEALADRLRLDVSAPNAPGTNLPAEGHRAFKNALVSTIEHGRELGRKQAAGDATDADLFELAKVDTARRSLLASYYGLRTEAGRALATYNGMARVMPSEVKIVNELLSRGRLRKDMAELGDIMANLPEDPEAAIKVLQSKEVQTVGGNVASYFTSNLVSGIVTQERNLFSNAFRAASRVALKAGAGPYDAARALLTGTEREVYSAEAVHEITGGFASLQKAWQDAVYTARHGYSKEALRSGLADETSLYVPPKEMIGGGANPLNYPRRGLDAVDRFFRQLNSGMELYATTYANARKAATAEGLTGEALSHAIAERATAERMNPSKALQRAVASAAERGVYQENAGPITNAILSLRRKVPALGYVLPFVRTPANIFKQGMEASPLGFVMSRARPLALGGKADARTRSIAQAEAAMGTAALAPLAYLAATERLSGSGPTDPAQRAALYESGWRPHSVRIALPDDAAKAVGASPSGDGEYWVSYSLFQPVAIPAAIVADGFEAWRDVNRAATKSTKEQRAFQTASQVVARVGKSALDQSYLSGLGDLLEAINDPERSAEGFVSRTAQGFIPFSGALRNIARQTDQTVRAPEGFAESVEANLPGLSRNVAPRLDRWGRPISREPQSSPSFAMDISPTEHDPVADELQRLGVDIGMPSARLSRSETKGWTQRPLTRDEAFAIRQVRGQSTRAILGVLMGAPGYESMPDLLKVQLIHRMVRDGSADVNEIARIAVQLGRPDILQMIAQPALDTPEDRAYTRR